MAGAGMSVWPRTVSVFKKWGIGDEFKEIVTQSPVPSELVLCLAWGYESDLIGL